jgi:hypothetical protein
MTEAPEVTYTINYDQEDGFVAEPMTTDEQADCFLLPVKCRVDAIDYAERVLGLKVVE